MWGQGRQVRLGGEQGDGKCPRGGDPECPPLLLLPALPVIGDRAPVNEEATLPSLLTGGASEPRTSLPASLWLRLGTQVWATGSEPARPRLALASCPWASPVCVSQKDTCPLSAVRATRPSGWSHLRRCNFITAAKSPRPNELTFAARGPVFLTPHPSHGTRPPAQAALRCPAPGPEPRRWL